MVRQRFALVARFFVLLGISLWLGGMAFFGAMAAPALFRGTRETALPELAPQLVGVMLSRFSILTYVCSFFLLIGWWFDGWLSGDKRLTWKLQGLGSLLALVLALYLGRVLLPQTVEQQKPILPIYARAQFLKLTTAQREQIPLEIRSRLAKPVTSSEAAELETFDVGHRAYQRIASLNLWLIMGILVLVVARSGAGAPTFAVREQSPQT